jgi:hypothetical protein
MTYEMQLYRKMVPSLYHMIDSATFTDMSENVHHGYAFVYYYMDMADDYMHMLNSAYGYPRFFVQEIRS